MVEWIGVVIQSQKQPRKAANHTPGRMAWAGLRITWSCAAAQTTPPPIRDRRSQSKCAYVVATYLSGTRREKGVGGPSGHAQGHVTGSLAYARTWAVSEHQLHVA